MPQAMYHLGVGLGIFIGLAFGLLAAFSAYRYGLRDGLAIRETGKLYQPWYSRIFSRLTKTNA